MATPFDPFRDVDRFLNQVSRSVASGARSMPMDLFRQGDHFIVKVDLPGVKADQIDIDVDDRTLTIRAERLAETFDTTDDKNQWVSRERISGTYARQITLGSGLDVSQITADYTDGVLTLTLPVAEEAKPRKIAVQSGSASPSLGAGVIDGKVPVS
ncbi:MAG: Hsp20/alpha crystallin family protein [Propionibacteriaceae bacterium]|jgi:HSP20 family protein|nr:Hsp20/alpha crystallin family protein [Propionibacteriaceae bacterium]